MSLFDLEASSTAVDVAFDGLNTLMAVLHRRGVDVYQWKTKGERSLRPTLLTSLKFEDHVGRNIARIPLQVCFTSAESLCVLVHQEQLSIEAYELGQSGEASVVDVFDVPISSPISSISSSYGASNAQAYAQDRSGKLFSLSRKEGLEPLGRQLSSALPWYQLVDINDQTVVIGMTRNGHLYADAKLLAKNCTSFVVTDDHLVFTTTNHFVKFVHLLLPEGKAEPLSNYFADRINTV